MILKRARRRLSNLPKRATLICMACGMVVYNSISPLTALAADNSATEEFNRSLPYWATAEKAYGLMVGSYVEHENHYPYGKATNNTGESHRRIDYAINAPARSEKYAGSPVSGTGTHVFVASPKGKFVVNRDGGDDAFRIVELNQSKPTSDDVFETTMYVDTLRCLLAAESFEGVRLNEVAGGKYGYHITSVRSVDRPEGRRLCLEFDWPKPKDPDLKQVHVTAILNPDMHCAIQEWDRVTTYGRVRSRNELMTIGDGIPFPKTYTWESYSRQNDLVMRLVDELDRPTLGLTEKNAPDQFTLAAYGLATPGELSVGSRMVIIGAGLLAVLGVVFAVLSRRKAKGRA